jgi:hypothetical protein
MREINPVGDSAESGFLLPNPVSIHREYFRPRFEIEWCMLETSTLNPLWVGWIEKWRYLARSSKKFRFQKLYSFKIAERLWGAVAQMDRRALLPTATSISAISTAMVRSGSRTTTGSTTTSIGIIWLVSSQLSSFLSRFIWRESFFEAVQTNHRAFCRFHREARI